MGDRTKRTAIALGVALLALAPADVLRGQEESRSRDSDERCVCVTTPDAEEIRERVLLRLGRRARLGVVLGGSADEAEGVPVDDVIDDTPADRAEIRAGDVIVAFDGHRLTEPLAGSAEEDELDPERSRPAQRLSALVRARDPGDEVEVTYRRDGEERTATVELDRSEVPRAVRRHWALRAPSVRSARPGSPPHPPEARQHRHMRRMGPRAPAPHVPAPPAPFHRRWIEGCDRPAVMAGTCVAGLDVRTLNPALGAYFGTDEGVVVLAVAEEAALALEPGDVIIDVDGREVVDADDLRRILRSYEEGEEIRLRIRRDGREMEVEASM